MKKPISFTPGPAWESRGPSVSVDAMAASLVRLAGHDEHKLSQLLDALSASVRIRMQRDRADAARRAGI